MAITWNPSDKSNLLTLSNGDLTVNHSSNSGWAALRVTESVASGKLYWEVLIDNSNSTISIGFGSSSTSLSNRLGDDVASYGYIATGRVYNNGSYVGPYDSFTTNDIIGVALDLDNGKVWWSKNNVWQNSGDPANGTNPIYTGVGGTFFSMYSDYYNGNSSTIRALEADFSYTPPTGFIPLEYVPPSYYFSGYIFEQNNPVSRKLYLHDRLAGDLVTTTTSSGNGYYYMETAFSGSHYIVCLDDVAGEEYNDLIIGSAIPTEII